MNPISKKSGQFFSAIIRFIEIKASLMDDPAVSKQVQHRIQVASLSGSGTLAASLVIPTVTLECLDMDDSAAIQAVCCRLGLPIPGVHLQTRCLPNCTQMEWPARGPHATLADSTVRENIMTGKRFWGCKSRAGLVVSTTDTTKKCKRPWPSSSMS